MSSPKLLPNKDFQTLGFLQEINRRILHPCGLSLEISAGEILGESKLVIVDYRDTPEGCYFDSKDLSRSKAQSVLNTFQSKLQPRREIFGHIIQPVPDYVDSEDYTDV